MSVDCAIPEMEKPRAKPDECLENVECVNHGPETDFNQGNEEEKVIDPASILNISQGPPYTLHPEDVKNMVEMFIPKSKINESVISRTRELGQQGLTLCMQILQHCPPSAERAIAITNVKTAILWAQAAIETNE